MTKKPLASVNTANMAYAILLEERDAARAELKNILEMGILLTADRDCWKYECAVARAELENHIHGHEAILLKLIKLMHHGADATVWPPGTDVVTAVVTELTALRDAAKVQE